MKTPCRLIAWAIAAMGIANATIVSAEDSLPTQSDVIVETLQLHGDAIGFALLDQPDGSAVVANLDFLEVGLTGGDVTTFTSVAPVAYIKSEAITFSGGVLNSVAGDFDLALRSPYAGESDSGLLNNAQDTFSGSAMAVAREVPTPETWAMLLTGLGLIGLQLHRGNPRRIAIS